MDCKNVSWWSAFASVFKNTDACGPTPSGRLFSRRSCASSSRSLVVSASLSRLPSGPPSLGESSSVPPAGLRLWQPLPTRRRQPG
jgi:hypothetical protein